VPLLQERRGERFAPRIRTLPRTNMTDRSRDPESTTDAAAEQAGARRKSRRGNTGGKLATLLRRCESNRRQEYKREDPTSDTRSTEHRFRGPSSSKLSFLDFVCNIKKHLLLKNLCKSKKKVGFSFLLPYHSFLCPSKISSLLFFRDDLCPFCDILSEIILSQFFFRAKKQKRVLVPVQNRTMLYPSLSLSILAKSENFQIANRPYRTDDFCMKPD